MYSTGSMMRGVAPVVIDSHIIIIIITSVLTHVSLFAVTFDGAYFAGRAHSHTVRSSATVLLKKYNTVQS